MSAPTSYVCLHPRLGRFAFYARSVSQARTIAATLWRVDSREITVKQTNELQQSPNCRDPDREPEQHLPVEPVA